LLGALPACGQDGGPGPDAASDVEAADAADAAGDVADAGAEAAPACTTGLPDAGTAAVVCYGTTSCPPGDACCIDQTAQCATSCPALSLDWQCDRTAHCASGSTCCLLPADIGLTSCPGFAGTTSPRCQTSTQSCPYVVCQTDADCGGGSCYAVAIDVGGGHSRTLGVCQ
jgi:hypothetical protein